MERKIADELYSEILSVSNIELDPKPIIHNTNHDSQGGGMDDPWYDDDPLHHETEKLEKESEMDREWRKRQEQFYTIGYRDGLMAGKEASAQEGFNIGFKESVFIGKKWGSVRGVTSALACLPDALKERLIEAEDKRDKLQYLHESVRAISTIDALKCFHNCHNDKLTEQEESAEASSHTGDLRDQCSDENVIQYYTVELNSLLQCSSIKVHLE